MNPTLSSLPYRFQNAIQRFLADIDMSAEKPAPLIPRTGKKETDAPPREPWDYQRPRLTRALAPIRAQHAWEAVDAIAPQTAAMLIQAARGTEVAVLARCYVLDRKTVKDRLERAAVVLLGHYEAETRRPAYVNWGENNPSWKQTPNGADIVARAAKAPPSAVQPPQMPPGDAALAAGIRLAAEAARQFAPPGSTKDERERKLAEAVLEAMPRWEEQRRKIEARRAIPDCRLERDLRADAHGAGWLPPDSQHLAWVREGHRRIAEQGWLPQVITMPVPFGNGIKIEWPPPRPKKPKRRVVPY
jgi:hypothetical protein